MYCIVDHLTWDRAGCVGGRVRVACLISLRAAGGAGLSLTGLT